MLQNYEREVKFLVLSRLTPLDCLAREPVNNCFRLLKYESQCLTRRSVAVSKRNLKAAVSANAITDVAISRDADHRPSTVSVPSSSTYRLIRGPMCRSKGSPASFENRIGKRSSPHLFPPAEARCLPINPGKNYFAFRRQLQEQILKPSAL